MTSENAKTVTTIKLAIKYSRSLNDDSGEVTGEGLVTAAKNGDVHGRSLSFLEVVNR
jgi:hypothetical protein